jgi:hypothetical protein
MKLIAKESGVNYHAVRRYAIGGLTSCTRNAEQLCKYFRIATSAWHGGEASERSLIETLRATWDGSDDHAELLRRLIVSVEGFSVRRTDQGGKPPS